MRGKVGIAHRNPEITDVAVSHTIGNLVVHYRYAFIAVGWGKTNAAATDTDAAIADIQISVGDRQVITFGVDVVGGNIIGHRRVDSGYDQVGVGQDAAPLGVIGNNVLLNQLEDPIIHTSVIDKADRFAIG